MDKDTKNSHHLQESDRETPMLGDDYLWGLPASELARDVTLLPLCEVLFVDTSGMPSSSSAGGEQYSLPPLKIGWR